MAEKPNTSMEQSAEDGDQETVTLSEVLESQEQMMEDANAVLGAIDDKKCTYSEGYMKRQALYSCLTCIPEAKNDPLKGGGICLACSYYCHEGHELVELYTKRNFCCDCGNPKFPKQKCNLNPTKFDLNELNQYNQNFSGLYCTCKRPYPDPEDTVSDEMIQCIICEDWYHSRHLGTELPPHSTYTEMTCESCVKQHEFLLHYEGLCVTKVMPDEKTEVEVEKEVCDEVTAVGSPTKETNCVNPDDGEKMEVTEDAANAASSISSDGNAEPVINGTNIADATSSSMNISTLETDTEAPSSATEDCKKPKIKSDNVTTKFWADADWRKQLCKCSDCLKIYEDEKVLFLLDSQDTVLVYEEKGKAKAHEFEAKQHDQDMKFINSLNRVPLLEAIAGFNDMKTNLIEYLKKFAENKKIVREEDIREFFSGYDAKKKQKCEIPHSCR